MPRSWGLQTSPLIGVLVRGPFSSVTEISAVEGASVFINGSGNSRPAQFLTRSFYPRQLFSAKALNTGSGMKIEVQLPEAQFALAGRVFEEGDVSPG